METIFMNTESSKTNEQYKCVLNLSHRLGLRSSDKHVALQSLSIYYTWKNIRKQCETNKLKIITQTWNDKFELSDASYSVSDIQDCIKYIIKKHEALTAIPPIHVYINRISNRLLFKIKGGSKLELKTSETSEIIREHKKINR